MTAEPASDNLILTRILDAPRALVFAVWTNPQHLARWWGPHGFTNPECRADARPGGEIFIRMVGHGYDHGMKGRFEEVIPPERLVFTSQLEDESGTPFVEIRNTVTFADHGTGRTVLTLHARVLKKGPGSEGPLAGMEEGWTQSLERLDTYTSGLKPDKITPFLWFDGRAEEAMNFYTSVFKNAKIIEMSRYGEAGPGEAGSVMTVTFEIEGQRFIGLNGGPHYSFTPAISFMVHCDTQNEVDVYWDRLSAGGEPIQCGWINDKFGLTWQIVPNALHEMLEDADEKKSTAVMQAMMQMVKLDIAALREAYDSA